MHVGMIRMYDVIKVTASLPAMPFMGLRLWTKCWTTCCVYFNFVTSSTLLPVLGRYTVQVKKMRIHDVMKVKYTFRCHSAVYPALLQL